MEFLFPRARRTHVALKPPVPEPAAAVRCAQKNLQALEKLYESPRNTNALVSLLPPPLRGRVGEGGAASTVPKSPLYLPIGQNVRMKRLTALAGAQRPKLESK